MVDPVSSLPSNAPAGDWLFRQGELVLGPVSEEQLLEKLYAGELSAQTEVSRPDPLQFKRIADTDHFRVHLAKAEAKQRVDAADRRDRRRAARRRNLRIFGVGVLALVAAAGVAVGAYYFAVYNPLRAADPSATEMEISIDASSIRVAKRRSGAGAGVGDELLEYPGAKRAAAKSGPPSPGKALAGRAPVPGPGPGGKLSDASDDPEGLQTAQFDQGSINSVVGSHQKSLYPCLIEEARKQPGLTAKVPVEFVIGNDGKVSKVWVDHPSFKGGPLEDCMLKTLQRWPFKPYEGERATVALSFNIGKAAR